MGQLEDLMARRNTVAANIEKACNTGFDLNEELEKARSGVYADTAENRKMNRVGQKYGSEKKEEETKGQREKKREEEGSGKTVSEHAAGASDEALKRAAADDKASPEVKAAAEEEMKKRGKTSKDTNTPHLIDGEINENDKDVKRFFELNHKIDKGVKLKDDEEKEYIDLQCQFLAEMKFYAQSQTEKLGIKIEKKTVEEFKNELLEKHSPEYIKKHKEQEKKEQEKKEQENYFSNHLDIDGEIYYMFDHGEFKDRDDVDSVEEEEIVNKLKKETLKNISDAIEKYGVIRVRKELMNINECVDEKLASEIIRKCKQK